MRESGSVATEEEELGEQVKFDVELYEYVREMSKRRSAISCCVIEHAMEV